MVFLLPHLYVSPKSLGIFRVYLPTLISNQVGLDPFGIFCSLTYWTWRKLINHIWNQYIFLKNAANWELIIQWPTHILGGILFQWFLVENYMYLHASLRCWKDSKGFNIISVSIRNMSYQRHNTDVHILMQCIPRHRREPPLTKLSIPETCQRG